METENQFNESGEFPVTTLPAGTTTKPPNRSAGWAAIVSGMMGIMGFGFLIGFAAFLASQKTEFKELETFPC